jgi:hypothetical protein
MCVGIDRLCLCVLFSLCITMGCANSKDEGAVASSFPSQQQQANAATTAKTAGNPVMPLVKEKPVQDGATDPTPLVRDDL